MIKDTVLERRYRQSIISNPPPNLMHTRDPSRIYEVLEARAAREAGPNAPAHLKKLALDEQYEFFLNLTK